MTRTIRRAAVAVLASVFLGACAETVIETTTTEAPTDSAAASTTTVPTGTTDELLGDMAGLMRGLNSQIAAEGDERATLAQIDAIWLVIRPDIETTHPELVNGIDTSVEMSRTAVVRIRPADADKATQILDDQIERYRSGE